MLTHSLKAPGFNPREPALNVISWFQAFAFKWFNLYRYVEHQELFQQDEEDHGVEREYRQRQREQHAFEERQHDAVAEARRALVPQQQLAGRLAGQLRGAPVEIQMKSS
jgi:hypothetical protein